jgi:hypothetical protein
VSANPRNSHAIVQRPVAGKADQPPAIGHVLDVGPAGEARQ